ncbi:MAG: transglycosylase domain-containing protein [Mogibacterium sp.]|nr:transglycosylase domain-containing protein [Mogibacterium sp.]
MAKKRKANHKAGISPRKKKRARKKHPFIKAFFLTILFVIIFGSLAAVGGAAWYGREIIRNADPIDPTKIYDTLELSTQIYDDRGRLLDEIYYNENRRIVTYEQLPDNLKNAFVAVEDKTFWEHSGFNFRRIFGAILDAVHGGRISGTSTITQQLARNIFLPEEKEIRSIERKVTEMYYAYEIEQVLSKEEILTAYLNTIYLGYSCYGVDTASRVYFSKEVEDLSLEQCAALAALPQAPGEYALLVNEEGEKTTELSKDLYVNDISEDRRNMVLDLMAEQGMITAEEATAAKMPATEFIEPGKETEASRSSFKDYLIETVQKDLMEAYNLTAEQAESWVYTKGLRIYSTLDTKTQSLITNEFKDDSNFPGAAGDENVEAAMVISEVETGHVKAMVGGRKNKGQMLFNRATSPRQPGSSIKPISVYAPALQKSLEYAANNQKFKFVDKKIDKQGAKGYGDYLTAGSNVTDEPLKINGKTWPLNASRSFTGKKTFRRALELSINTCAVKILTQIGIDYSMEMVQKFGITTAVSDTSEPYNDVNLAALALGAMTEGVTPLEMSLAYATFPNGGVRYSPVCYTKVENSDGEVILDGKPEEVRVLDEGVAWIMTDILRTVVSDGLGSNAKISGVSVGGKTGTTNDNYDIWFNGFTPKYSAALWVGTDENVSMFEGSSAAASLWSTIMSQVDGVGDGSYRQMPENVIKKNGEYYTKGTEPKGKDKKLAN